MSREFVVKQESHAELLKAAPQQVPPSHEAGGQQRVKGHDWFQGMESLYELGEHPNSQQVMLTEHVCIYDATWGLFTHPRV